MTTQPDITTPLTDKDGRLTPIWRGFLLKQVATLPILEDTATLAEVITAYNNLIDAAKNAKVMK